MQNALKVLIAMCQVCSDDGELGRTLDMIPGRIRVLMRSPRIEVCACVQALFRREREGQDVRLRE